MGDIYTPNAMDWIGAFQAGQEVSMTRKKRDATTKAVGLMSAGKYDEAAQLIIPYDPELGLKLGEKAEAQRFKTKKTEIRKAYQSDPKGALNQAMELDEDFYAALKKVDDDAVLQKQAEWGSALRLIANKPEDQWDDEIAASRPYLEGLGIPAQEIDSFLQATPQQRTALMAGMLGRAKTFDKFMEDREKATDNRRADQQFEETRRHNKVSEGQGAARIGISRQQVGVAQAGLGLRREQHDARLKGKGGYGRPIMGGADMSQLGDDELQSLLDEGN